MPWSDTGKHVTRQVSHLLPEGGDGAWEPEVEGAVQAAHIHAQLQRIGGAHCPQVPLQEGPLDLAAFLQERRKFTPIRMSAGPSNGINHCSMKCDRSACLSKSATIGI